MLTALQNLPEHYRNTLVEYQRLIEDDLDNSSIVFEEYLTEHGISVADLLSALNLDEDDVLNIYRDCDVECAADTLYPVLIYNDPHDCSMALMIIDGHFPDLNCKIVHDVLESRIMFLDEDAVQMQFILEHISVSLL